MAMRRTAQLIHIFLSLALLVVFCGDIATAEATHLPADVRTALQNERDFTTVKRVDQIPSVALSAFHAAQDDKDYGMANPKGAYQKNATVTDPKLPLRQLQFAAISPDYVLIHFAKGGPAPAFYSVLLKKTGEKYAVIWVGEGDRLSRFHKFVKGLNGPHIDDRPGYAY
jgi:hypothetical protein